VNGVTAVNQWIRDIRTLSREWARIYTPTEDLTPIVEVKENLYVHLVEHHSEVVETAFRTPIFMPVCTWHIVGRDVKQPLADRGYVFVPNLKDNGQFGRTRDLLMRKAIKSDDKTYISLEYDLLGALLDRQERLARNSANALTQTKERRVVLQTWLAARTAAK